MIAPIYQVEGLVIDLFTPTVSVRAVTARGSMSRRERRWPSSESPALARR